jgi:hypothetical protein
MHVVHTDGDPPSSGSTIFANSGWTQKISSAFRLPTPNNSQTLGLGSWEWLAVGSWQLAVGSWQLGVRRSGKRRRQLRLAHQVFVDGVRRAAAFSNRPYDQRLAPLHVAGGEDAWDIRHPL